MTRGRLLGAVVVLAALIVAGTAIAKGSPKPAAYAAHDVLAGKNLYQTPEPPAMLAIGDSFFEGTGAAKPVLNFGCQAATRMGWICHTDAEGGTGFIVDGHGDGIASDAYKQIYVLRIPYDRQTYKADVIIVNGGRNDMQHPLTQIQPAVDSYMKQLRAAFPKAKIVVLAPIWQPYNMPGTAPQLAAIEHQAANAIYANFIDPLAEKWITTANKARYIGADQIHPNVAGHAYLADRLVADLRADGLTTAR